MSRKFYSDQNYRFKLDESHDHLVSSEYELVFLKNKNTDEEICIDSHYGDPSGALILMDNNWEDSYVIISGYGLSIYEIKTNKLIEFWNKPDNNKNPDGLYFPFGCDDNEFGFVMYNYSNELRVFMGNAKTLEFKELK